MLSSPPFNITQNTTDSADSGISQKIKIYNNHPRKADNATKNLSSLRVIARDLISCNKKLKSNEDLEWSHIENSLVFDDFENTRPFTPQPGHKSSLKLSPGSLKTTHRIDKVTEDSSTISERNRDNELSCFLTMSSSDFELTSIHSESSLQYLSPQSCILSPVENIEDVDMDEGISSLKNNLLGIQTSKKIFKSTKL